jgi:hypothetical protein
MGLADDPTCEKCLEEDESATHVLCDCEAIAHFRLRHLGQFFMEPSDYYDAPVSKVLHIIRSMGLIKGYSKGKHNRSAMVAVQRARRVRKILLQEITAFSCTTDWPVVTVLVRSGP